MLRVTRRREEQLESWVCYKRGINIYEWLRWCRSDVRSDINKEASSWVRRHRTGSRGGATMVLSVEETNQEGLRRLGGEEVT